MLLLTRGLCKDGEHAWDFYENWDDFILRCLALAALHVNAGCREISCRLWRSVPPLWECFFSKCQDRFPGSRPHKLPPSSVVSQIDLPSHAPRNHHQGPEAGTFYVLRCQEASPNVKLYLKSTVSGIAGNSRDIKCSVLSEFSLVLTCFSRS